MDTRISIELYSASGGIWRYDSYQDGPIGEWLCTVGTKLGKELNGLSHNATVYVFPQGK